MGYDALEVIAKKPAEPLKVTVPGPKKSLTQVSHMENSHKTSTQAV